MITSVHNQGLTNPNQAGVVLPCEKRKVRESRAQSRSLIQQQFCALYAIDSETSGLIAVVKSLGCVVHEHERKQVVDVLARL